MRHDSAVHAVAVVFAVAINGRGQTAAAQTTGAAARFDFWAGIARGLVAPTGELASTYSPPLFLGSEFTSSGGQTLTLNSDGGIGFEGGLNLFTPAPFGVQILFDRVSSGVSGVNGPYTVALTYVSRPPNSEPQTVHLQQSVAWPDTTGSGTRTSLAVNGVVRLGRANAVNATLSAGVAWLRLAGTAKPLAYTTFRLGGHSVLFSDEYHLAGALQPTNTIGFDAAADINIPIASRMAAVFGIRYLRAPMVDVPVRVSTVLNADQVINEMTAADIAQQFAPGPARTHVTASRVVVGLKFMR